MIGVNLRPRSQKKKKKKGKDARRRFAHQHVIGAWEGKRRAELPSYSAAKAEGESKGREWSGPTSFASRHRERGGRGITESPSSSFFPRRKKDEERGKKCR